MYDKNGILPIKMRIYIHTAFIVGSIINQFSACVARIRTIAATARLSLLSQTLIAICADRYFIAWDDCCARLCRLNSDCHSLGGSYAVRYYSQLLINNIKSFATANHYRCGMGGIVVRELHVLDQSIWRHATYIAPVRGIQRATNYYISVLGTDNGSPD